MAETQTRLRLWWVATYYDGSTVYESERPGEVSSESIDRHNLKRFTLVDADGVERFALDFPEGDDPRLVYRRRTVIPSTPVEIEVQDAPGWMRYPWTYIAGSHHSDGRLELFGMNADGDFEHEGNVLTHTTGAGDSAIEWTAERYGAVIDLALDLEPGATLRAEVQEISNLPGPLVRVWLPGTIVDLRDDDSTDEDERLELTATASDVALAVQVLHAGIEALPTGNGAGLVWPEPPALISDVELVPCELF